MQYSAEMPRNQRGDILTKMEANMCVYRYGEISHTFAASERTIHVTQWFHINWREPNSPLCKVYAQGISINEYKECGKRLLGSRMNE